MNFRKFLKNSDQGPVSRKKRLFRVMNMIGLSRINTKDTTFRLSFPHHIPSPLLLSIKKVGILNPVILREIKGPSQVQIISGFRRFAAAQKLKYTEIPAVIHTHNTLSDNDAFLIALFENLATRGFNIIEQALVLERTQTLSIFSEDEVIYHILPLFNIEPNRFMFERTIKLLNLPPSAQTALAEGKISIATAEKILLFPRNERVLIMPLILKLNVGKNKAETIVDLLFDITKREHKNLKTIINEQTIRDILFHKSSSGQEKYHVLQKYLNQRRFPQLTLLNDEINHAIRSLPLSPHITVAPPPQLEGDELTISCKIKNTKDLTTAIRILQKLVKNPALKNLFNKI